MTTARPLPKPDTTQDAAIVNPLDSLIGYQLRRASAAMMADLAASIESLALRPTDISVLLLIEANPAITQSELGRLLGIQRANMAPIAAALAERGLIDRLPVDGRSQGLVLSGDGATLIRVARARIAVHEARFLPDASPAERRHLIAMLRSIWGG